MEAATAPSPAPSASFWKTHSSSLLAAGLLALICSQRYTGIFLDAFFFVWVFWLPYSAYVLLRKPAARRRQLWRLAIWFGAAGWIALVHTYHHHAARHYADEVVAKIEAYRSSAQRYPASLDDIGISNEAFHQRLSFAHYSADNGNPSLFYAGTFEPFSTYAYDFRLHTWRYRPG